MKCEYCKKEIEDNITYVLSDNVFYHWDCYKIYKEKCTRVIRFCRNEFKDLKEKK